MTTNASGHDWDAMGIVWEASDVQRQHGDHASDRTVLGVAQIPRCVDLDKARASGLEPAIMAGVNGTSWRVTAQEVSRRYIESCKETGMKYDAERLRDLIYSRLRGLRTHIAGATTRTVTVHNLPNGEVYAGNDENDYRQLFAAALVDMGVDATTALAKAALAKW